MKPIFSKIVLFEENRFNRLTSTSSLRQTHFDRLSDRSDRSDRSDNISPKSRNFLSFIT